MGKVEDDSRNEMNKIVTENSDMQKKIRQKIATLEKKVKEA